MRLVECGAAAHGQSSWGPTGFAIFGGQSEAEVAVQRLCSMRDGIDSESIQIAHGCNRGAQLHPVYAIQDRAVAA